MPINQSNFINQAKSLLLHCQCDLDMWICRWRGGRSIKLEGSDHVPVYMILNCIPDLPIHNTPPLAVRYLPEVRGWQQTIVPFLRKRQLPIDNEHPILPDILTGNNVASENGGDGTVANLDNNMSLKCCKASISTQFSLDLHQSILQTTDHNTSKDICSENNKPTSGLDREKNIYLHKMNSSVKKIRHTAYSQLTIRSYFQKPKTNSDCGVDKKNLDGSLDTCDYEEKSDQTHGTELIAVKNYLPVVEDHNCGVTISDQGDTFSSSSKAENRNATLFEWQRIQKKMKLSIPLCKGHGEPCVPRSVKKEGPNIGRKFYCCARAQGPAANPEANCGHFEWANKRS